MKSNDVVDPWVSGWLVSVLLLLLASNCSLQEKTVEEPVAREVTSDPVEQSNGDNLRADNSFCYVCHLNYDGESLTADHEQAGIGCAKCHGRSYDHCGDENNITPPEIMYPAEKINPFCMGCHPKDDINTERHRDLLAGKDPKYKTCTDCHGDHRLVRRQVKWKKTDVNQLLTTI